MLSANKERRIEMKKASLVVIALVAITVTGCESSGPWGPDVVVRTHNVPSTQGTLVTVINSTPYRVELIANGASLGTILPQGRATVSFRRLYLNWYSGEQEMLVARVKYRGTLVTLSRQLYTSNWTSRVEVWEITPRMVEWKLRQMRP